MVLPNIAQVLSFIETDAPVMWYLVRASGIMAMFALALSIFFGILLSTRYLGRNPSYPWLTDLHRYLSSMLVLFVVIHLAGLYLDDYTTFTLKDIFVPYEKSFAGSKWGITAGIIAFWLLAAVEITSLIKKRLPKKLWHGIHLLSYVILSFGIIHAVNVKSSDLDNKILISFAASAAAGLLYVGLIRVFKK